METDWSQYAHLFVESDAKIKQWRKEWRQDRKIGNLKKRMPSKKKRKKYYEKILKRTIRK